MKHKRILYNIQSVLLACDFEHTIIEEVSYNESIIQLTILLPYHREQQDIEYVINNLQQELNTYSHRITKQQGKRLVIQFARTDLTNIIYNSSYLIPNSLKLKLPTSFGEYILDFEDGASCHMLNGGAPRMGKTIFLLYLSTILYLQTNSEIELFITSPKSKDFYPLFNLPNVTVSQDETEFMLALDTVINEYKTRNSLLYSKTLEKATDAKSVKDHYPHHYHLFKPIFFIIDEYARFSHIKPIQEMVAELVQTAGYVNIHVIIATQRPDARNTLPANIKMGLMCRICFRTADKNNSIVILDEEGAEILPNEKGRAILKDGDNHIVQIPHMKYEQCEQLLQPYKRESKTNEPKNNQETARPENNQLTNKIQNLFTESTGEIDFQSEQQPDQCMQPHDETIDNGWFRLASKTIKG